METESSRRLVKSQGCLDRQTSRLLALKVELFCVARIEGNSHKEVRLLRVRI